MNFSKEMIEKAKNASSAEDLLEMAKANGIELSTAEAETYFSFLKDNGPLSDEELEQVAGGKHDDPDYPDPKYHNGDILKIMSATGPVTIIVLEALNYSTTNGWNYRVQIVELGHIVTAYLESNITIL